MSQTKHTPEPWQLSRDGRTIFASIEGAGVLIHGIEQTIPQIAYIARNGFAATINEQLANARLITAAPELLAACKLALVRACQWSDNLNSFNSGQPKGSEAERMLRAAVAKAEGSATPNDPAAACENDTHSL